MSYSPSDQLVCASHWLLLPLAHGLKVDLSDQFFNTLGSHGGFDLLEDPALELTNLLPEFKLSDPIFDGDISAELEQLNSLPGFSFPTAHSDPIDDMAQFNPSDYLAFDVCCSLILLWSLS